MTKNRRPATAAVLVFAVVAVSLAGCGRKGPLEPPPIAAATQTAPTDPATPATTPAP